MDYRFNLKQQRKGTIESNFAFLQSRLFRIIFTSSPFFLNQVLLHSQPTNNNLIIKLQHLCCVVKTHRNQVKIWSVQTHCGTNYWQISDYQLVHMIKKS